MFGAIRFLWNATRGNRFTPWRSEYLKWRIETYSGKRAATIDSDAFWKFVREQQGQLLHFLRWTCAMAVWERSKPESH